MEEPSQPKEASQSDSVTIRRDLDVQSQANLKYWISKLSGGGTSSAINGRSHSPTTLVIPINQNRVPQLLDFSANDFANGITWDGTNSAFVCVTAGVYAISGLVSWFTGTIADGVCYSLVVKKNGTLILECDQISGGTSGGLSNNFWVGGYDIFSLAVGDVIKYYAMQASNATATLNDASGTIAKV